MSPIRFLSASLFAFALSTLAQTPSNVEASKSVNAASTSLNNHLRAIAGQNSTPLTARLNTPCLTMRTYGFTNRDLQSYNPRPSTYSTCTLAKPNGVSQIDLPAKLTPVK